MKKQRCVYITDTVWNTFQDTYKNKASAKIEELMSDHLGISLCDKRYRLISMKDDYIKLEKSISELESNIENTERLMREKLSMIWSDFRKRFQIRQDDWKEDNEVVLVLKRDYNIVMTYKELYEIWEEME